MSISRKNWSALSTLAQQWVLEDEEECEREKKRKTRCSSSTADPEDGKGEENERDGSSAERTPGELEDSKGLAQVQMDFVEMLRVRDERRRDRHIEILRRQKQEEEGGEGGEGESWPGEARVEVFGELGENKEKSNVGVEDRMEPSGQPPLTSHNRSRGRLSESENQRENGSTNDKDSISVTPQKSSGTFVSSVSISFDKSPTSPTVTSRLISPLSPRTPPHQVSLDNSLWSPTTRPAHSSTQNGDAENGSLGGFESTPRPAFTRQSSRTVSFRMMKKKEEERMPLQRSASVRIASRKFEPSQSVDQEEEQQSPFQRISRQRISSRSIKEKMERLAQASQKWEMVKSPTMSPKSLALVDEVSRKRTLFEKEDFQNLASGVSDRFGSLKKTMSGVFPSTDLRHVDISSKRSVFERGQDEGHK